MAIVQLDKVTLYGAESGMDRCIEQLQELGCVHLIDLGRQSEEFDAVDSPNDTREALKYLLSCRRQLRQVRRDGSFAREQIVRESLQLRDEERDLSDEWDELNKAIRELEPWGEFQNPNDGRFGHVRFWFYVVPLHNVQHYQQSGLPWREVARDHRSAYIVLLGSRDTPQPPNLPGIQVEFEDRPLSELRSRREHIVERLEELHHQRTGLTRWCGRLASALDEADDLAARQRVARQTFIGTNVYALQGWVPREATAQIREFARQYHLAVTIESPEPGDEPPTLLHNPENISGSEKLVTFYKTPEYRSWDPSIVAYLSFAVFFAMILADAGYGLIFAIFTIYFWKPMGRSQQLRRGRVVLATVVGCTVIYGLMCGSYFGLAPTDDSMLGRLKILDVKSQSVMMPLTIVVGVIHLSLANMVTAWLNRGRTMSLASLGWVVVMTGATLAGIGVFGDLDVAQADRLQYVGGWLLAAGLAAVFLFNSRRPLRSLSLKNHILRILDGFKGLTGLSALFGDVLSYLRLFALGLSSTKLAETFNGLAATAWDRAGFGVIAAIAIVVLGHTLNMLLGVMGGVVHGLRLNCIEFFKWCLPEEGYRFRAFEKKVKQP